MKKIFLINIFALVFGALNLAAQCTIQVVTSDITDETCVGSSDASATAFGAGVGQISYLWSNGQTTATTINLTAGTYTVTATDDNGCTGVASVNIIVNPEGVWIMTSSTLVTCNGGSDGTAYAGVMTGVAPYTFLWDDPNAQTTVTATGLTAGQYHVLVTDVNGCSNIAPVTVEEPTAVVISSSSTNEVCFGNADGSATANGSGGTGQITYLWSDGQTTATATGLTAGTYTVTATDANGCPATENVVVSLTNPQIVVSSTSSSVLCFGGNDGSATVSVTSGNGPFSYSWSNGQTGATATGLAAGTYTATVTGADGCTSSTTVAVTEPNQLVISTSSNNISCHGANDGSATASSTGGTGQVTYSWSNGGSGTTISNLSPGTYTVTGTDANGCTNVSTVTITEPSELTATSSGTDVTTVGGNDGTATANPSGGTPGYTYLWSNGGTTQTISGLTAGTYTATITDANGCTTTTTVIINQPIELVVTSTPSLCGANDGTATVSATGGIPPYTYLWNNGQTNATATGLAGGTYSVTVTDAVGNTSSTSVTVLESSNVIATASHSNETCVGSSDGHVAVSTSGGVGQMTFSWSNGATTSTVNNLGVGTYTVTVTDTQGCTATASTTIELSPEGIWVDITTTHIPCFGGNNGSATAIVTTGVQPYTYAWSNGGNTPTISNLTAGDYTVTVTDTNGCIGVFTTTVTQPTQLIATTTSTNISCNINNGTATVSATGGTLNYSYLWNTGSTNTTITGLGVGTYTATVTDANGCTAVSSTTISNTNSVIISNVNSTNPSAVGASDGSIDIEVSGGTPGYTYMWSNGATTQDISGLVAGCYTVTVTDMAGCSITQETCINPPCTILINVSTTDNGCAVNDMGSATVTVTQNCGNTNYTYNWTNDLGFPLGTTQIITGLSNGTYLVTVTDGNGLTATGSGVVNGNGGITSTASSTNISCNGDSNGTATANGNGGTPGYTYMWSSGVNTQSINGLTAGTYTVTVTDQAGCTSTSQVTITEPNSLTITSLTSSGNFTTSNGAIDLTVAGGTPGYTYMWSNGATTEDISGLSLGCYTVTVTDMNMCTASQEICIDCNFTTSTTTTDVSCFGGNDGSATVTASGGSGSYDYDWNTGGTTSTISNLTAGTYTVTVTDITDNCTSVLTVTITEPTQLVATVAGTNPTTIGGNDGEVDLTVTGGTPAYIYLWNTGATTEDISMLTAGCYTVTVTDANMCTTVADTCLTDPPPPPCNLTLAMSAVDVSCFGGNDGSATVTASGGSGSYDYDWNTGGTTSTISSLIAGTYTVTVTDQADPNCTAEASITVNEPTQIVATAAGINPSTAGGNDGSVDLTVTGGTPAYTYLWNTGAMTEDISMLTAGCYTVTVTDANMCTTVVDTCLIDPLVICDLTLTMSAVDVSCFGGNDGSATATVTGGSGNYDYDWNTGGTTSTISNLTAGIYTVTVTDQADTTCTAEASITVNEPAELIASGVGTNPSTAGANDGSIDLTVTGGTPTYTYLWSNGATTEDISMLTAGCYTVTVTDANNCTATSETCLTDPPMFNLVSFPDTCSTPSDGEACVIITDGWVDGLEYEWKDEMNNPLGTSSDSTLYNLAPGTYFVTVTDPPNVLFTSSIEVTSQNNTGDFITDFTIEFDPCFEDSTVVVFTDITTVSNSTTNKWEWYIEPPTPADLFSQVSKDSLTLYDAGTYTATLIVTAENTCVDSLSKDFTLEPFVVSLPDTITICADEDDDIQLNPFGNPNYQYVWSNGIGNDPNPMVSPDQTTVYSVTITNPFGAVPCMQEGEVVVFVPPAMDDLAAMPETAIVCKDSSVILSASSTFAQSYSWHNASPPSPGNMVWDMADYPKDLTVLDMPQYFYVVATDAYGCMAMDSVLAGNAAMELAVPLMEVCPDDEFTFDGSGITSNGMDFEYWWMDANGDTVGMEQMLTVTAEETTTYSLIVENEFNCVYEDSYELMVSDIQNIALATADPDTIILGETTVLDAKPEGEYTYLWNNESTLIGGNNPQNEKSPTAEPTENTMYTVTVTDNNLGCTATASILVTVIDICDEPYVFIPNAFSPNDDGENDELFVRGVLIDEVYLIIYNRWGEKVFESNSKNNGWDGKHNGEPVCSDVYGYYLRVNCLGGKEYIKKGNITVLK